MSQPTENEHLHVETTEKRRTSVVGKPAHAEHDPLIDHKIP